MARGQLLAERFGRSATVTSVRRSYQLGIGVVPAYVLAAAALILILTSLDVSNHGALTTLDHAVSRHVLHWGFSRHGWRKVVVYPLTYFGQRFPVLLVTVPTVVYLSWRSRSVEPVLRFGVALLALEAAVYAIKDGLRRTAPPVDIIHSRTGSSFPSGHLANAILVWGVVWWCARAYDPGARLTRVLRGIWLVAPFCVVIAMTLLDYHWISDFIAGACVGVLLLAAVTTGPLWPRVAVVVNRWIWRSHSGSPGTVSGPRAGASQ
jgi:membrane-associated phospholipid phosphatase